MADFEKAILDFLLNNNAADSILRQHSNKLGWSFILKYAEANHLLFALVSKLDKRKNLGQNSIAEIKQTAEEQNNMKMELLSLAKKAQKVFDTYNCCVILMKSFYPFPYIDNDLDFVDVDGEFSKSKRALERSGFVMISDRSYIREPLKRFFAVTDNNCFVHLHSAFSWDGVQYLNSKTVWKHRQRREIDGITFYIPSPTHDFLITAGHALFENKCVYMSDFINAITLVKSEQVNWNELLQMANEVNWKSGLLCFLAQIEAIYKKIYSVPLLPQDIPRGKEVCISDRIIFPFVLKRTFSSSFKKFFLDIVKLRFRQIPRQLFSYTIVDYCLYRRIVNHKDRLENLYVDLFQRN